MLRQQSVVYKKAPGVVAAALVVGLLHGGFATGQSFRVEGTWSTACDHGQGPGVLIELVLNDGAAKKLKLYGAEMGATPAGHWQMNRGSFPRRAVGMMCSVESPEECDPIVDGSMTITDSVSDSIDGSLTASLASGAQLHLAFWATRDTAWPMECRHAALTRE